MQAYVDLLNKIINEGETRTDRTGVGTMSIFGGQVAFDLRERFPLVTVKKTLWKSAFIEMLWFLRGENNTNYLKQYNVPIWDDWVGKNGAPPGELGPIYGVQWRKWPGKVYTSLTRDDLPAGVKVIGSTNQDTFASGGEFAYQEQVDQVKNLIEMIKTNPTGRRHIVTAWNPAYIKEMGLPPCHRDFQCYVSNDGHLDLMMAIRSWDTALGGPFNIAQYALLTHLLARATGLKPRHLKINYGDAHLYLNHVEPIREMLATRHPIDCKTELVIATENTDIDGYKPEDFAINGYDFHPFIKLPIAV
jgi:thymidylate synthase